MNDPAEKGEHDPMTQERWKEKFTTRPGDIRIIKKTATESAESASKKNLRKSADEKKNDEAGQP